MRIMVSRENRLNRSVYCLEFTRVVPGKEDNWASTGRRGPYGVLFGRFDNLRILSTKDPWRLDLLSAKEGIREVRHIFCFGWSYLTSGSGMSARAEDVDAWIDSAGAFGICFLKWDPGFVRDASYNARLHYLAAMSTELKLNGHYPMIFGNFGYYDAAIFLKDSRRNPYESIADSMMRLVRGGRADRIQQTYTMFGVGGPGATNADARVTPHLQLRCKPGSEEAIVEMLVGPFSKWLSRRQIVIKNVYGRTDIDILFKDPVPLGQYLSTLRTVRRSAGHLIEQTDTAVVSRPWRWKTHPAPLPASASAEQPPLVGPKEALNLVERRQRSKEHINFATRSIAFLARADALRRAATATATSALSSDVDEIVQRINRVFFKPDRLKTPVGQFRMNLQIREDCHLLGMAQRLACSGEPIDIANKSSFALDGGGQKVIAAMDAIARELRDAVVKMYKLPQSFPVPYVVIGREQDVTLLGHCISIPEALIFGSPEIILMPMVHEMGHLLLEYLGDKDFPPRDDLGPLDVLRAQLKAGIFQRGEDNFVAELFADYFLLKVYFCGRYKDFGVQTLEYLARWSSRFDDNSEWYLRRLAVVRLIADPSVGRLLELMARRDFMGPHEKRAVHEGVIRVLREAERELRFGALAAGLRIPWPSAIAVESWGANAVGLLGTLGVVKGCVGERLGRWMQGSEEHARLARDLEKGLPVRSPKGGLTPILRRVASHGRGRAQMRWDQTVALLLSGWEHWVRMNSGLEA